MWRSSEYVLGLAAENDFILPERGCRREREGLFHRPASPAARCRGPMKAKFLIVLDLRGCREMPVLLANNDHTVLIGYGLHLR